MRKDSPLRVIAKKTVSLDKEEENKKEQRKRRQRLKRQAFQKEFYKEALKEGLQVLQGKEKKLQVLQGKEKLQANVRKANGDLDFPGEHFPPSLIYIETNGTNRHKF